MRRIYRTCFILFWVSIIPFFRQTSLGVGFLLFGISLVSLISEVYRRKLSRIIRFGLMFVSSFYIFHEYGTLMSLESGVALLSLLAVIKTFELSSKRDLFTFTLIIQLSLVGHLLSVEELYMVITLVGIVLALFWPLLHHNEYGIRLYRDYFSRQRRIVFQKIFLFSIPLTVFLFFAFPRFPLGNIFFNTVKKVNVTGFVNEINPGSLSEVIQDGRSYFRATFDGAPPPLFELYWRGSILAKTDGFSWSRLKVPSHQRGKFKRDNIRYQYKVDYDFFADSPLFFLDGLKTYDLYSRGYATNWGANTFHVNSFRNEKIRYRGYSGVKKRAKRGDQKPPLKLSDKEKALYLQLPPREVFPKFSTWSQEHSVKNLKEASVLFSRQIAGGGFSYSLAPGEMDSAYPLDDFFFSRKIGLCEHYASAFAVYLRTQGIPSRVVVGFLGGEFNPFGDYYYIKGTDAHAWVEAYDSDKGWKRIDPTKWINPNRIQYGAQVYGLEASNTESEEFHLAISQTDQGLLKEMLFLADVIYYNLNTEFLGFDFDAQKELFSFLDLKHRKGYLKLLLMALAGLFVFGVGLVLFLKRSGRGKLSEFDKVMILFRKKIQKRGGELSLWWGPATMESYLKASFPEDHQKWAQICRGLEEYRYNEKGTLKVIKDLVLKL